MEGMNKVKGMGYEIGDRCIPKTLQAQTVLHHIIEWANNIESENRVYLLLAQADSGDFSVAHAVARYFDQLHRLGSSFFCSRSKELESRPEKVLFTIAYDIAKQYAELKESLADIINTDGSLRSTASLKEQFGCIKKICARLELVGPLVVVIDALDECGGDSEDRKELMKILAEETLALPKNFRFFITARRNDAYVENALKTSSFNVDEALFNADRHLYILTQISEGATELSLRYRDWQNNLTRMSRGDFSWILMACKFIRGDMCGEDKSGSGERFEYLLREDAQSICLLRNSIFRFNLRLLDAVIANAEQGELLFIDCKRLHPQMALLCLEFMNISLKFNICGLKNLYAVYGDIPSGILQKYKSESIGDGLAYACRYWAMHVAQTDTSNENIDSITAALNEFLLLEKHLMHWIEVVSILDSTKIAMTSMRALVNWYKVCWINALTMLICIQI